MESKSSPIAAAVPTSAPVAGKKPAKAPGVAPEKAAPPAQKPVAAKPEAQDQKPIVEKQEPLKPFDPPMSDAPAYKPVPSHSFGHKIVSKEEKVEYRDQDGNLLDEEQVMELKGKVSFKTRYETRTRLVDGSGNEIESPEELVQEKLAEREEAVKEQKVLGDEAAKAVPSHPDTDGVDPETVGGPEVASVKAPAEQPKVAEDVAKEEVIPERIAEYKEAQPASDVEEATDSVPHAEL